MYQRANQNIIKIGTIFFTNQVSVLTLIFSKLVLSPPLLPGLTIPKNVKRNEKSVTYD